MNKPHLDVFRDIRNTNQEERPSRYSDITSACKPTVKCPSSQGQNKRMRFLNMSATPFGTALQRYGNYLENVQ